MKLFKPAYLVKFSDEGIIINIKKMNEMICPKCKISFLHQDKNVKCYCGETMIINENES
jgi:hypothetical protein